MYDTLSKLTKPFGVSGDENEIAYVIENEIEKYADEIKRDPMGNLIAIKRSNMINNPANKFVNTTVCEKILLAAHMDTIGIIVTHIDEKGFIRFSNIGGLKAYYLLGQCVEFSNGLRGVVYHDGLIKEMKDFKIASLYIDTGLSVNDVKEKFKLGDYGRFLFSTHLQGDNVISGCLDDRAGCAILIETAKIVAHEIEIGAFPAGKEIYYVFTAQEELGLRGAGPAANTINPDLAIAVDVTYSEDIPGQKNGNICLGKGPVIMIKNQKTISHTKIKEKLKMIAEKFELPYQFGITDKGATDAGAIHTSRGGIITGELCIPVRYIHTSAEMCSVTDLKNAVQMLAEVVRV